jgi:hypothetical protein
MGANMLGRIVALLGIGVCVAGCASSGGFPDNPVDIEFERADLAVYFQPLAVKGYLEAKNEEERKRIRNEIIFGRVAAYDVEFAIFQQKIVRERSGFDTAADVTGAGLTAAGTILTSGSAKTAAGAATLAVTSVKGSVDKNIFWEKSLVALLAQMDANRATVLADIEAGTRLSTTDYPLTRGFVDLAAYREAGSLPGAIAGIARGAGEEKANAKGAITQVQALKANGR